MHEKGYDWNIKNSEGKNAFDMVGKPDGSKRRGTSSKIYSLLDPLRRDGTILPNEPDRNAPRARQRDKNKKKSDARKARGQWFGMEPGWQRGDLGRGSVSAVGCSSASGSGWGSGGEAAATTQSLPGEHRADSARQDQHARIYDTRRSTRVARSSSSSEDHSQNREEARRRSDKRRSRSMSPSPHRLRQRTDEVHSSCSRNPPARRGGVWRVSAGRWERHVTDQEAVSRYIRGGRPRDK